MSSYCNLPNVIYKKARLELMMMYLLTWSFIIVVTIEQLIALRIVTVHRDAKSDIPHCLVIVIYLPNESRAPALFAVWLLTEVADG